MQQHVDILDEQDSLRAPLVAAVTLHAVLFGAMAAYNLSSARRHEQWGVLNPTGGAVGVEVVSSIPLVHRAGNQNPLASETQSQVPLPPVKQKDRVKEPEPSKNAIPLKSRDAKRRQAEVAAAQQRFRPYQEEEPNQVYSTQGQAVSAPLYAPAPGSGGVGTGPSSALGTRFGGYEQLIRQLVAQKWRTGDVDPRLQNAPTVIVTFDLQRDGNIRNLRILQRSGNAALDFSAQRAILEAAPFPPIPPGFERDSAKVELWFEFKR